MNGAFYIGATGLRSEQSALDVIANNIANINTTAYKRTQVRFSELLGAGGADQTIGAAAGGQAAALSGVQSDISAKVFSQGELRPTNRPMDVAINGDGFIELMGPAGQTLLWRGGELKVNGDGYLAASNGMALKAMISVPMGVSGVTVGADGQVKISSSGDDAGAIIGQIDLAMARDVSTLEPQGDGLYRAEAADLILAAPGTEGAGLLVQGSTEASNVQLTDEMVSLMLIQRAYAANAQVIQAGDQLMAIANGLRR